MKRLFLASIMMLATVASFGHRVVSENATTVSDTIYYDSNRLNVLNKSEASYYRLLKKEKKGIFESKVFQDFYLDGTLKAEGGYNFIDLGNDKNTTFDGTVSTYYPNGSQKWTGNFVNGKPDGYFTLMMQDGSIATVQFVDGKSKYDYFVITDKNGQMQKRSIQEINDFL
mgnify:FL=1